MRVLPLRFAALALALASLSAGAFQDATPSPTPAKPQDPPPILEKTKKYMKVVTEERGLPFKSDVKTGLYSKDELLVFLKEEMKRESPPEKLAAQEKALKHFGLVPAKLNLNDAILSLLGSSIAGFYHPKTKELRLVKGMEGSDEPLPMFRPGISLDDITLVHELTHAAQDQSYDLDTLPLDDEENDDLVSALKGLIEGDATVCSMRWGMPAESYEQVMALMNDGYKQAQLPGEAGELPAYLRRTITFGYGYGAEFVMALMKNANGKWTDIDKAYVAMPMSTEQILHPEKFLGPKRDHPKDIRIKDVDAIAGGAYKRILTNVHGEFGVYLLLNEFKALKTIRERHEAAAGWGGDRFWIYEAKDGATGSVWFSTWDSAKDATEFYEAYLSLLKAKYPKAKTKEVPDAVGPECTLSADVPVAHIQRSGTEVLVLDGGPIEAFMPKINDLFKGATQTELTKVQRVTPKKD